jgi:hypothetical protein
MSLSVVEVLGMVCTRNLIFCCRRGMGLSSVSMAVLAVGASLPVRLIHLKKFGHCVNTFGFWGMCHTSMALYFYRASKMNVHKPTTNS